VRPFYPHPRRLHVGAPTVRADDGRPRAPSGAGGSGGTLVVMPSERDLLLGDEEMLAEMRPHPAVVLPPLLVLAAAIAIAVVVIVHFSSAPVAVVWVLVAMVALPALWCTGRLLRWRTTRFMVTDRRILYRRGVLRRELVQLRLQRVAEVECNQTIVDRAIGRGRLVFDVLGAEGQLVVDDVRRPRRVQRLVSGELDARDPAFAPARPGRGAAGPWAPGGTWSAPPRSDTPPHGTAATVRTAAVQASYSVSDALIQLDELRRRGVISQAEFSAKKAELLDRL
jgi:membrane protein YdbS with pleckstrin-like domain